MPCRAERRKTTVVIIDADYLEDQRKGHVAGVVCNSPLDDHAQKVVTAVVDGIGEYIPGQFYKRELKCAEAILRQLNLVRIDMIIVDGYADFGTEARSLGAHVYEEYKLPVVGIAKNRLKLCVLEGTEVYRGESLSPLYVTAKGIEQDVAKDMVRRMVGPYRIPDLVKLADKYARDWSC